MTEMTLTERVIFYEVAFDLLFTALIAALVENV
jgi:hypothetical protein